MLRTKLILDIFGKISGLTINLHKSELAITSSPPSTTLQLAAVIQCKQATFPMNYLGLPLSDKRLTKMDYLTLVERVQLALAGWKAPLLSIGGRIILTNSVLSAIPQYYMSVFMLPKWTLRRIDQIRRRFLWHGHKTQQDNKTELYMVNWKLATKPRSMGGLGIRDVHIANQALLIKWMWLWLLPQREWWKRVTVMERQCDRPWDDPHASPFWKSLKPLAPVLDCSTTHQIRQGNSTLFWHDSWCGKPLKYSFPNLYNAAVHQFSSVEQNRNESTWEPQFGSLDNSALIEKSNMLHGLQSMHTTSGRDEVTWTRSPQSFTVSSAYLFLASSPAPRSLIANIWSIKAPLRVLVFAWLMLSNRLTTLDNLSRKGWFLPSMCVMCRQSEETTHHLFHACSLAKEVRDYIYVAFAGHYDIPPTFKAENSFLTLSDLTATIQARQWELVTCFSLWVERCNRTFQGSCRSHISLVREIKEKYEFWFS